MPPLHPQVRSSLCRFTFADGRRCRSPRVSNSPDFCHHHAEKDARSRATQQLAKDLSWFFSGNYLSANDLNTALAHVFIAVARGDVQPRAARTLAYLAQTMFQTLHLAQDEFITARGKSQWLNSVRNSIDQNHEHRYPSDDPSPASPDAPASPAIDDSGATPPATPTSSASPDSPQLNPHPGSNRQPAHTPPSADPAQHPSSSTANSSGINTSDPPCNC
jgi:hypothetical protein